MKSKMLILLLCTWIGVLDAQTVRPVRDDIGFCWNAVQMNRLVGYLKANEKDKPFGERIVAAISPHDDYLYAGRVYYPLFRSLKTKEVVIFGVTHGTVRKEIGDPKNLLIFDSFDKWTGPNGNIGISPLRQYILSRLDTGKFIVNNKAHELEHSIEALIPFLQYYNPGIKITPIMVTAMDFETMKLISATLATIITEYINKHSLVLGRDICFLISSDANHYGKDFNNTPFGEDETAHTKGIDQDVRIAKKCLSGSVPAENIREFTERMKDVVWCGKYSIPSGLLTANSVVQRTLNKEMKGSMLRYSDTYSGGVLPLTKTGMGTTAPFSLKHWVGFLSEVYTVRDK
jgi:AmmeMemoRadiSam system protein B